MYSVIDVETTGLRRHDRIVELAIIHVDRHGARLVFDSLVSSTAPLRATGIHHIASAELVEAPEFVDVASMIHRLLVGTTLVAHNLRFDWAYLRREFARAGATFLREPAGICTATLAGDMGLGRSLARACDQLAIPHPAPHHAAADAWATHRLRCELARRGAPMRRTPLVGAVGAHRLPATCAPPCQRGRAIGAVTAGLRT